MPPLQYRPLQESLKKLGELPEGSAVIAGSTMVRAKVQIEVAPTSPSQSSAASNLTLLLRACVQVQACLGVLWGKGGEKSWRDGRSDVDIFCSAKAAPAVRSVSGSASLVSFMAAPAKPLTSTLSGWWRSRTACSSASEIVTFAA